MKKRFFNIVTTTGLFAFIFIFLFNTKRYSEVALEGLRIFYLNVLPCLFPFFVISKLLVEFNCLDNFYKVFYPLTRRFAVEKEGAYVFLISLVSGFPVGVSTATEMCRRGILSKESCENVCTFSNFAGPIFVIGTVGNLFDSTKIALILYLSSVLGGLLNGLIFCKKNVVFHPEKLFYLSEEKSKSVFYDCIYSSVQNILFVGATIVMFYLTGKMIFSFFQTLPLQIEAIIQGFLEMTGGVRLAAQLPYRFLGVFIASMIIGFGGLCVYLQCCAFWQKCGINCGKMLLKKATQAVASSLICLILLLIFGV